MTCAFPLILAWFAASGAVEYYDVFLNAVPVHRVTENRVELCVDGEGPHEIWVMAHHSDGHEVVSDSVSGTYTELVAMIGSAPPIENEPTEDAVGCQLDPAVCCDLNRDGTCGLTDFGMWHQLYGSKNDGQKEIE